MTLEEARKAKSRAMSRLNNAYWKFQRASSEYELACIKLAESERKANQEPELTPCLSCGMAFDLGDGLWDLPNGKFYIMCPDCEAMTPDMDSQEEAVTAWNNGDVVFPRDR